MSYMFIFILTCLQVVTGAGTDCQSQNPNFYAVQIDKEDIFNLFRLNAMNVYKSEEKILYRSESGIWKICIGKDRKTCIDEYIQIGNTSVPRGESGWKDKRTDTIRSINIQIKAICQYTKGYKIWCKAKQLSCHKGQRI